MRTPSWDEFDRGRQAEVSAPSADGRNFFELCAIVFSSGPGRELLAAMRARTIEQRTPANAPDTVLREAEAQRRFVADLELACARGAELLAAKKAKPA